MTNIKLNGLGSPDNNEICMGKAGVKMDTIKISLLMEFLTIAT